MVAVVDSNMNEVVTYSYDILGKLLNIGKQQIATFQKTIVLLIFGRNKFMICTKLVFL